MSSTTPVVENVVVENVTVTVKEKKPRKARASNVTAPVSQEAVSQEATTEVPVPAEATEVAVPVVDKKQKKPRKVKTDTVAVPVVAELELESEPLTNSEAAISSSNAKKPRAPTLPAKYNKFLQFGYYLMQSLKDAEGNINVNSTDHFIEQIHLFDSLDNQKNFVQEFFDQTKDINKAIRKLNADKKKASVKAAKLASKMASKPAKPTKPAKKNNKNTSSDDTFVSDIVSLATNNDNQKPKRKYNKKTNLDSDKNIIINADDIEDTEDTDDNNLDVDVMIIDGVNYLVDANKRVFDFNSHNLIGNLDSNNVVVLI
jgi:hypothetical protein